VPGFVSPYASAVTGNRLRPFPPAPLRTDRDRFRVNQLSSQATSTRFRSLCISHPLAFQMVPSLSPFAMWPALPAADYYEDSVTMGLAPVRPSRVPLMLNVSSAT
jgi:hypothetical protein